MSSKPPLDASVDRVEPLGPLGRFEESGPRKTWAFSPFLSITRDPETDISEFDLLFPALTYDRFGSEYRFQVFQLWSLAGGATSGGADRDRITFFPIFFLQRSPDPESRYLALIPLGGHLKNRLMRDEITFALLPLYLRSRKNETLTHNFLFPFFHLRDGPGLRGAQLWPLFGRETKQATARTNDFGETQIVGGHSKRFALWPFYFDNELGIGTDDPQKQRLLLPFVAWQQSSNRTSSTYLWPFGFTRTTDRAKKYDEWSLLWPFISAARGEGKSGSRIWPLFGRTKHPGRESTFYLWPAFNHDTVETQVLERSRTRILFFGYSDLVEKNKEVGSVFRRRDLWPLFTDREDHSGRRRFQALSVLEPFLPNNHSIERNYSALWSIWRSEKDPASGMRRQAFLWNLYAREATPAASRVSFLCGLFSRRSGSDGTEWRAFSLPILRSRAPAAPGGN